MKDTILTTVAALLVLALVVTIIGALIYADWWSFNQKFPHASFWAWVISPR